LAVIESELFKRGMRRLAAGVCVVTTIDNKVPNGFVATSVSSVSIEPTPSLLVCVNRIASCHGIIQRTGAFCVNLLRDTDVEVARRFSTTDGRQTRFDGSPWVPLATGAPALLGALASFDCRVSNAMAVHSHTIFIGDVKSVRLWQDDVAPLVYLDGRFETLRAATP
jgi:flavin reductase